MRITPIILSFVALAAIGCQPIGSSVVTPSDPAVQLASATLPVEQVPAGQPAPIYLQPGEPAAAAPGTPIIVHPTIILPPGTPIPGSPAAAPTPEPGWLDVLPSGAGAISPDFGLPRGPVVENRLPNPLVIPVSNNELAWDQLADVVTDYFPIGREQPVQAVGGMLTEGFIETPFQTGATLLEPQRNDSVGRFNRWQATLQSIRRKAFVNVQPTPGGYAVRVNVVKQLEDLPQPEQALAGAAVLRSDNALPTGRRSEVTAVTLSESWIDLGRDEPLEQEMLRRIRDRLAAPSPPSAPRPVF
ncbi:MAG: hypothetical protein AAGB00_01870 [Planctomycetota bacterium]